MILSFAISNFRNEFSIGSRTIIFCSGSFQVTLTESWQRNRNLLLNANIGAGKLVTVAMSKSGQLTVASHILVPDLINSGFKHKVDRNH